MNRGVRRVSEGVLPWLILPSGFWPHIILGDQAHRCVDIFGHCSIALLPPSAIFFRPLRCPVAQVENHCCIINSICFSFTSAGNTLTNQEFHLRWAYVSFEKSTYIVNETDKYLEVRLKRRGSLKETAFVSEYNTLFNISV